MDIQLVENLFDVLKDETDIYNEILKISKAKTNVIVEGKVAELENMAGKEQAYLMKISGLEEKREQIVAGICRQLDRSPEGFTASVIAGLLPREGAERFNSLYSSLAAILNDIRETNRLNAKLIRNSLEYIDFSINLIAGSEVSNNTYGNSGQVSDARKRNLFDMKL